MAALTSSREIDHFIDMALRFLRVAASKKIFKGSFVGLDPTGGFARALVAGDKFLGLAYYDSATKLDWGP